MLNVASGAESVRFANEQADRAMGWLKQAVAAGLVREEGEGYAFGHALIRETIYAGLGLARRKRLHLRAAEALEAVHIRDIDAYLGEIADHYRLCVPLADPKNAIGFARRAGEAAAAVFAYERAIIYERTALQLMDRHTEPEERVDLAVHCQVTGDKLALLDDDMPAEDLGYLDTIRSWNGL